jgi:hypothetical protein
MEEEVADPLAPVRGAVELAGSALSVYLMWRYWLHDDPEFKAWTLDMKKRAKRFVTDERILRRWGVVRTVLRGPRFPEAVSE